MQRKQQKRKGGEGLKSIDLAKKFASILEEKKGENIVVLEIGPYLFVTDYFVIVSGESRKHVKTLAQYLEEKASEMGYKPVGREGVDSSDWILLDYGDVVVHIFDKPLRDYYRLEKLWGDALRVQEKESIS
jgi:ribosome-associated protein